VERRLAAILAADVVGYSRMIGVDEAGTLTALRSLLKELVEPTLISHRGRVVKLMGDGLLAEFASVVDAVAAAVEIQDATPGRSANLAVDRRVALRIGVNIGDIAVEDGDIFGDGVNIAARLQEIADPNGVAVSDDAYRQLGGRLDLPFDDIGEKELKNIKQPVRVWMLSPTSAPNASPMSGEPFELPNKPSVAVLPFLNMSGDPEQEYFSDGIAEDVTTSLSKLPQLFVIARNSSFTYKGKAHKAQEIADELGVRYVVEGSVRKAGNRVRISAQLIDCSTGGHLWADRFDRELTDIFAIQDEVTQEIVTAMALKLSARDQRKVTHRITDNLEAYDYFLRGREQHWLLSREASAQAKKLLQEAIVLDPNCAAAHASLADSYLLSYVNGWDPIPDHSLAEGSKHAKLAVGIDPDYAHGHCAMGFAALWNRQHDRSVAEYKKAIALDPSYANAHVALGRALIYAGRSDEAIKSIEQGLRLDPYYHEIHLHLLAQANFQLGRYEEAVDFLRRRLIRRPDTDVSRILLAACYGHLGRTDEAKFESQEALKINPNYSLKNRRTVLPFKNDEDFQRLEEGLLKAGFTN